MPWNGSRATKNALILSPSADSAAARLLGCREGMQGRRNMARNGSRVTDITLILSPSNGPVAM